MLSDWLRVSGARLTIGLVALAAAPIVARSLGPTGRGELAATQLLPIVLADFATLGMAYPLIHHGSRSPATLRALAVTSLKVALVGSLVMMTVGYSVSHLIAGDDAYALATFRIYLLICPLTATLTVFNETMRALGDFRGRTRVVLVRGVMWPAALLVLLGLGIQNIRTFVLVHLVATALLTAVVSWTVWRRIRHTRAPCDVPLGTLLREGATMVFSQAPSAANLKLDQVLMGSMVTRRELGLYASSVAWSGMIAPGYRGLSAVALPAVSAAGGSRARDRAVATARVATTVTILVAPALAVATYLLWIPVFGARFAEGRYVAVLMAIAAGITGTDSVLSDVLRGLGAATEAMLGEIIGLVITVVGLSLTLRPFGYLGAAYVSLGAYVTIGCWYLLRLSRWLGTPPWRLVRPIHPLVGLRAMRPEAPTSPPGAPEGTAAAAIGSDRPDGSDGSGEPDGNDGNHR